MNDLISICIPTYNRPALLKAALESCAAQSYDSLEIVIGDDSSDDQSIAIVEAFRQRRDWIIAYKRNLPGLGQNANVNDLLHRATGDRLVLLHDDDALLPTAVEVLDRPWKQVTDLAVSFGSQQIISQSGEVDEGLTIACNLEYNRVGDSGVVDNPLASALLLRLPNDGFLILTSLARELGYRSESDVGVYCDMDFSLRLGATLMQKRGQQYFVNQIVSQYRLSADSISQSSHSRRVAHPTSAIKMHNFVKTLLPETGLEKERAYFDRHMVDKLVKGYALSSRRIKALEVFASPAYGWRKRLSGRGLYHLALILVPQLDRLRPYA